MSGGGSGLGGVLGGGLATGLGALLAPETFGASLAVPAALGAAGGALGSGVTGGSPLTGALTGGASGLAGGLLSGLLSPSAAEAVDAGDSAVSGSSGTIAPVADAASLPSAAINPASSSELQSELSASPGATGMAPVDSLTQQFSANQAAQSPPSSSGSWLSNLISPSSPSTSAQQMAGIAPKASSSSGGLGQYLLPAGLGLGALSLLFPQGSNPVNTSAVTNAQNSSNASLPSYKYNSVSTPYTGNWYTYGQRPQTPMISNTVTPAARGGLMRGYANGGLATNQPQMPPLKTMSVQDIVNALPKNVIPAPRTQAPMMPPKTPSAPLYGGYAMGGRVRALDMGGMPMQAPMGAPPQSAPMAIPPQMGTPMQRPQMPVPQQANPLQAAAQFQIGHKIGQALRRHIKSNGMTPDGRVRGPGRGQDDAIPAKLSQDEYVVPSEVVSQLGDGSSNAGGRELDKMVAHVRAHKTSHGKHFPPKAKSPLAYIGRA